jgi:RND superfamily putative drug exporter
MFAASGRFAYRRRWWVLAAWGLVLVAGLVFGGGLFDRLQSVDSLSPNAESQVADRQIKALVSAGPVMYAVVGGRDVYDPELNRSVTAVAGQLLKVPGVVDVNDLYTSPGGRIGTDNRSTLVTVEFAEDMAEADLERAEDQARALLLTIAAPTVQVGGDHVAQRAFGEQAVADLAVGESVAFALLLVALVVIFGGFIAASVPIVVAVVGVSSTLLVLYGLSAFTAIGEYSLNIVTLLGIGLAVDYALLIVARYREELDGGLASSPTQRAGGVAAETAIETAMARAGRAVAFSGLAVAVALAGLAAFAEPLLSSMALGGAAVAVLTTALALTAVPALLAVAGDRIPPAGADTWVTRLTRRLPRRSPQQTALLARLASFAQARPGPVALLTAAGLLLLALPLAGANFANSDVRALPRSSPVRQAYESYQALFAANPAAPVTIVSKVDASSAELRDYLNQVGHLPEVVRLTLRVDVPAGWTIIDLTPKGTTAGAPSRQLVEAIRADRAPFPRMVAGPAAELVDYQHSVAGRLPLLVVAVVLAMLVLLFGLTRSLVVPLKAVLLNAATVLATLGVLVVVFQWGWGQAVLRFDSWGGLDVTTPLLLFVFIFGLSMDYEVFLLARITEEYDRDGRNDRAVLAGISRSGPVVTAAAACITLVFAGFAVGGLVAVKEIGVGMAVAVILDVTVVRGLLLPATMSLLGPLNWWPRRPPGKPTKRAAPRQLSGTDQSSRREADASVPVTRPHA